MLEKLFKTLIACGAIMVLVSCSTLSRNAETGKYDLGDAVDSFEISDNCLTTLPKRVAILPFENETARSDAEELIRQGFYGHFSAKRYQDVELYDIDSRLADNNLIASGEYLTMPANQLGSILDVDGIIYGKITGFNKMFFGLYSNVYVELEVNLVDTHTGETLWTVKHKTIHHEGQIPVGLLGIVSTLFRTSIHISDEELMRTVDDLCRTVVSTLPEPDTRQLIARKAVSPPTLSAL